MANILGAEVPVPTINITGWFSSSWVYVLIVVIFGIIIIGIIATLLFFKTYNRKVVVFENISGQGYQPVLKTRARIVKLGVGGEEILKTFSGGTYVSAYGRKMGKNVYWYAKGPDGYWYNVILGDLDTKLNILDIEPIDRDVRMFHVALDRLSNLTYGKKSFMEKYGIHVMLFAFLIIMLIGIYVIVGKIGSSTSALTATAETNKVVVEKLASILQSSSNIQTISSGLVPAG